MQQTIDVFSRWNSSGIAVEIGSVEFGGIAVEINLPSYSPLKNISGIYSGVFLKKTPKNYSGIGLKNRSMSGIPPLATQSGITVEINHGI